MARRAPEPAAAASPPKRVTRARTRTVKGKEQDTTETSKPEAVSTTTNTAPKRGRPKKNPATVDTNTNNTTVKKATVHSIAKRRGPKPKTSQQQDGLSDDEMDIVSAHAPAPRAGTSSVSTITAVRAKRGRPRLLKNEPGSVQQDDDDDELAQPEPPKRMAVRSKPAVKASTSTSEPEAKARPGRRAKASLNTGSSSQPKKISVSAVLSGGMRRPHPGQATTALAKIRPANAPKKKVTFLDMMEDSDKENQPLPSPASKKEKTATVMKSKPLRRPVTPVSQEEEQGSKSPSRKEPLSPRTPNQHLRTIAPIAPIDAVVSSSPAKQGVDVKSQILPVKIPNLRQSLVSPAKKIDFNASRRVTELLPRDGPLLGESGDLTSKATDKSPLKDPVMVASPARRPPSSPYKDCIKESPRKVEIPFGPTSRPQNPLSPTTKQSPLKASPIKVKSLPIPLNWPDLSSKSPTRERKSLLQSPAKRLISPSKTLTSPFKNLRRQSEEIPRECQLLNTDSPPSDSTQDCGIESSPYSKQYTKGGEEEEELMPISPTNDKSRASPARSELVRTPLSTFDISQVATDLKDPFMDSEEISHPSTPVRPYESTSAPSSTISVRSVYSVPPAAPSPPVSSIHHPSQLLYRDGQEDSDAESDLAISPSKSPSKNLTKRQSIRLVNEEEDQENQEPQDNPRSDVRLTPLANKLSRWETENQERKYPRRRGVFSIAPNDNFERASRHSLASRQSQGQSFPVTDSSAVEDCMEDTFGDETIIHVDSEESNDNITVLDAYDDLDAYDEDTLTALPLRNLVGDNFCVPRCGPNEENLPPRESTITINAAFFEEAEENYAEAHTPVTLPMSVTPVRSGPTPRTIHTVSKVPLKTEDGSLKVPRKRTRSFSTGTTSSALSTSTTARSKTLPSPRKARSPLKPFALPQEDDTGSSSTISLPQRPKAPPRPKTPSPKKSPRKQPAGHETVLQGAVVFADVHTKEGADASGIFVELLTQMGARCVKSWSWNPRTSLSPVDGLEPKESKIGITHVIFKDGGVRTLQKVREANGVVKCVGVNWVLDCERSGKWLDEAEYAVDVSMLPRGGQKRRKSMEPKVLGNVNGTLVALDSSTSSAGSRSSVDPEIIQEFMRLSPSPTRSLRSTSADSDDHSSNQMFSTPKPKRQNPPSLSAAPPETPGYTYDYDYDPATAMSPITPYYLSQRATLVQQTCPPKQLRQGLFPTSEDDGIGQSESLRIKLDAARRKSLVWKPKVGSPLGRQM